MALDPSPVEDPSPGCPGPLLEKARDINLSSSHSFEAGTRAS